MRAFETRYERLELKYTVGEELAERVRRSIAPFCEPDAHNAASSPASGRPGYPIQSLYLDSPSLELHRAKERGDPERMKLRIRTYQRSGVLAVVELKRRSSDIIEKIRVPVRRSSIGDPASPLGSPVDGGARTAADFARCTLLASTLGAQPTLFVHYQREAYTSLVDEYARVTFDRAIRFQRTRNWDLSPSRDRWTLLEHHTGEAAPRPLVVLEVKCHSTVPGWVADVIRRHDLRRDSFSKYSIGIYATSVEEGRWFPRSRGAEILA